MNREILPQLTLLAVDGPPPHLSNRGCPDAADRCLRILAAVRTAPSVVLVWEGVNRQPWELVAARIRTAQDFEARGKGLVFRGLVEGWDAVELVREVY